MITPTPGVVLSRRVLSLKELASYLGVATSTIHRMILGGRGPKFFRVGTRHGGDYRFNIEDVEAWRRDVARDQ